MGKCKSSRIIILGIACGMVLGFYFGKKYQQFIYDDICLDLGGGKNPGGFPICIIPDNTCQECTPENQITMSQPVKTKVSFRTGYHAQ